MFKEASRNASTSPTVVTPTSSTLPAIMTPEYTLDDPDDPNSADEGDIQMEYTSYQLFSPGTELRTV
jgi:hypothetical protein